VTAEGSSISFKIKEVSSSPCDKVLSEQGLASAGSDKIEIDFLDQVESRKHTE
jgi:hypothetical protein